MAYRKKYTKRPTKRKTYRKVSRKTYKRRSRIPTSQPSKQCLKLQYFDQITINPPVGDQPGRYIFRANSIFDPDYTGVGHQPLGFDQWMTLYTRYHVIGAKCTATFVANDTTSANSSAICGIIQTTGTDSPIGITNYIENKKSKYRVCQLGTAPTTISSSYSTKKSQGIKNLMDNYELSGTFLSNPLVEDFFQVFVGNVNTTDDASRVSIQIKLEYIVVFSDPVRLTQS